MQIQISWLLQKLIDLDLHYLQRLGISGLSRARVKMKSLEFLPDRTNFCLTCLAVVRILCNLGCLLLFSVARLCFTSSNIFVIMLAMTWENVTLGICRQRRPRLACASAQSNQGLCCPQTEIFDPIECINGEQMHR